VVLGETKASDVQVDRGGADNRTPQHFSDAGDDSFPLPGDYVATVGQAGTGRDSAVGYIDPNNQQKATAGDKRIYARDPATGDEVVEVWLKSDGTTTVANANGSFTLAPDGSITGTNANGSFSLQVGGDFVVNGVTIAVDGTITTPTAVNSPSVVANGKELAGHNHPAGTPPGNTGPNN
jgi:hypothetical protein